MSVLVLLLGCSDFQLFPWKKDPRPGPDGGETTTVTDTTDTTDTCVAADLAPAATLSDGVCTAEPTPWSGIEERWTIDQGDDEDGFTGLISLPEAGSALFAITATQEPNFLRGIDAAGGATRVQMSAEVSVRRLGGVRAAGQLPAMLATIRQSRDGQERPFVFETTGAGGDLGRDDQESESGITFTDVDRDGDVDLLTAARGLTLEGATIVETSADIVDTYPIAANLNGRAVVLGADGLWDVETGGLTPWSVPAAGMTFMVGLFELDGDLVVAGNFGDALVAADVDGTVRWRHPTTGIGSEYLIPNRLD